MQLREDPDGSHGLSALCVYVCVWGGGGGDGEQWIDSKEQVMRRGWRMH